MCVITMMKECWTVPFQECPFSIHRHHELIQFLRTRMSIFLILTQKPKPTLHPGRSLQYLNFNCIFLQGNLSSYVRPHTAIKTKNRLILLGDWWTSWSQRKMCWTGNSRNSFENKISFAAEDDKLCWISNKDVLFKSRGGQFFHSNSR